MKQEIARERTRRQAKLHISSLPFSAIPHQSRLFLEYQREPLSLRKYYPNAVASPAQIADFVREVLAEYTTNRDDLCDALSEINTEAGAAEATFANIDLLRAKDTVAIVTGQQAGLFTGPLYTIYKALSAIKLAEKLSQNGTRAVPVFWIATEDHDYEEVSEAFFLGRSGELVRTEYTPEGYNKDTPVGSVKIDGAIDQKIDDILNGLLQTEFSGEIREILSAGWSCGTRFGKAFAGTLAKIFSRYGLIFLDPQNAKLKKLSAPIYAGAIRNADQIVTGLERRSGELERDEFHSQVLVESDYFPLFWLDDEGRRTSLRLTKDGVYRAKGANREFTLAELEAAALTEPERFSPGVMLRPAVQDFLLPTVCYFGGGAEIAYFAQNSEVYRILGRPVTPILHRQSFTVVEARQRQNLEKLDLDFERLFESIEDTSIRLAETTLSPETALLFASVDSRINTELNRLDRAISQIDVTLEENLVKRRKKMMYHIAALRKKTLLAQVRNDETAGRQLRNVYNALLPNGELQERSLNIFTFLNKFGLNFIDWIYHAIDLDDKGHRIIDL